MVSVCSPLPAALAAELSGRADADRRLDELGQATALIERTSRADYRIHPLLRSYLVADLARHQPETLPRPPGGRRPMVVGRGGAGARPAPRRAVRRPRT